MKIHSRILYAIMITLPLIIYWNRNIADIFRIGYGTLSGNPLFVDRTAIHLYIFIFTSIAVIYYTFLCKDFGYKPSIYQKIFFISLGAITVLIFIIGFMLFLIAPDPFL